MCEWSKTGAGVHVCAIALWFSKLIEQQPNVVRLDSMMVLEFKGSKKLIITELPKCGRRELKKQSK